MKKGKELKINKFNNYKITYGSVDNKNSKAIYIKICAWGDPKLDDDLTYNRIIRNITKTIKQNLFNKFNDDVDCEFIIKRTIVDLDMRVSGVRYGKKSFTNCDVTLFLNDEVPVNSDIIRPKLDEVTELIVGCLEDNKYFTFYKRK